MIPRHDSYQKVSGFMCPRSIPTSLGGHIPNIGTSYFGIATLVAGTISSNYGTEHALPASKKDTRMTKVQLKLIINKCQLCIHPFRGYLVMLLSAITV
jgi:hypothetical protein